MPDDYDDYDDYDDELSEEEGIANCSGYFHKGRFTCGAMGSEDCDWECPLSDWIGLTSRQIDKKEGL